MKLDLPSPGALLEEKKGRIAALLDAELYLPRLVEQLSAGFMEIDSSTAARWAGWIVSLRDDPAWSIVEPALSTPGAWPEVWQQARKAGFSETTEHHQAIFFTRLFERAIDESQYALADHSWTEALESWKSLSDGNYLRRVILAPVADELTDDQFDQVLAALVDGPLALLGNLAKTSLRLESWSSAPARRPMRFALAGLNRPAQIFSEPADSALAAGVCEGASLMTERLNQLVSDELGSRLDSLDLVTATLAELLDAFDGALLRSEALDNPPQLERSILRRGLALIWDLREMERDDELGITPPLVERLEPVTARLREAGGDDFFGLQGAVADLMVFKGEESLSLDARQQAFEQALDVCPGHRNASRLLSYLLLERANRDLLKTATVPAAGARIGLVRRQIKPLVDRASEAITQAEELYPENDLLDRYREDLQEEIERFKLVPEADRED